MTRRRSVAAPVLPARRARPARPGRAVVRPPLGTTLVSPLDRRFTRRRLVAVNATGAIFIFAMMGRATQLQVVQKDTLDARGERQRLRLTPIRAERGDILDRFGAPLAMSVRDWRLVTDPSLVADPAATAAALVAVLPLGTVDQNWLTAKLSERTRYAILVNGVDKALKDKIESAKIGGIFFVERFRRENPAADLARSVIGRVDTEQRGASGLELLFNDQLTGVDGLLRSERSEQGLQIPGGKRTVDPATSGKSFVTTLDRSLQYAVDGMNSKAIADSGAKGGIVIVSDPRTGEIFADSNMEVTDDGGVRSTGRNSALVNVYEPGSVNKVITMAAAIEERVVTPQSALIVPDQYQVGDHKFSDDTAHKTMRWTIRDVLVNSSNVGTIKVAQTLNRTRLDRYLRGFGLGSKTAVNFPGESGGILLPTNKWTSTSIGTVPIGQGISVTAVQMLSVFNTLANGGVRMPMRIVRSTVDERGVETPFPLKEQPLTVVSKTTADIMTSMLVDVVDEGTGRAAQVKGYSVAGKTGTARKPNEGARGYREGAYVASFAGYFPAESPRLSIIVVLDEPKTSIYGGVVAAPLFAEVARWAGQHYRIPPSAGSRVVLTTDPTAVVSAEMNAVARTGNWQGATIRRNALPTASALAATSPAVVDSPSATTPTTRPTRPARPPRSTPTVERAPAPAVVAQRREAEAPTPLVTAPAVVTAPPTTAPRVTVPDLARKSPAPARATIAPAVEVASAGDPVSATAAAPKPVVVAAAAAVQTVEQSTP